MNFSPAQFQSIFPLIESLEKKRARAEAFGFIGAAIFVLSAILLFGPEKLPSVQQNKALLVFGVLLGAALAGISFYDFSSYRKDFKRLVVESIFRKIFPGFHYRFAPGVSEELYMMSQLFLRRPDRFKSEDYVQGTVGQTPIEFAEIHSEYKQTTTDYRGRQRTTWHTIFKGVFIAADFHKNTIGRTFIHPDIAESVLGSVMGEWVQDVAASALPKGRVVRLENVDFEQNFVVTADSDQEARYILTPKMMELILRLKVKHKAQVHMAVLAGRVFVGLEIRKNLFEPRFLRKTDYTDLVEFCESFKALTEIVEDLDLNTRIWTKA